MLQSGHALSMKANLFQIFLQMIKSGINTQMNMDLKEGYGDGGLKQVQLLLLLMITGMQQVFQALKSMVLEEMQDWKP